jgi:hypothetical protein
MIDFIHKTTVSIRGSLYWYVKLYPNIKKAEGLDSSWLA